MAKILTKSKPKNSNQIAICKNLKNLLFSKDITYAQLATKLGISENNLTCKINGKRRWWADECVIVTKILGLSDLKEVFPEIFENYYKETA